MILYLDRSDIDVDKYNYCISNAINSRIYAYSWYLDCVADNWGILVLRDYEAVMPLPWKKKYLIKYVYLVNWVQQLGVFYQKEDGEIIEKFFNAIPREFKFVEIFLNSHNLTHKLILKERYNYVLNLDKPYVDILKNFSKGRKSDIKKAEKSDIEIKLSTNPSSLIKLFKQEKKGKINVNDKAYESLEKLTSVLRKKDKLRIYESYVNEELLGGAFFLFDANRITYLFSAITAKGRNYNVMSFIISDVLREYEKTNILFDFEGSMIKSIASFFKSYGALEEVYYHYKKYRLF